MKAENRRFVRQLGLPLGLVALTLCVGACRRHPPRNSEVEVVYEDPISSPTLTAALANPTRSKSAAAHDPHRHPVETLDFFGVRRNSYVLELGPNDEYYTEILAPFLYEVGKLRVAWANGTPTQSKDKKKGTGGASLPRYPKVGVLIFDPASTKAIDGERTADVVLAVNSAEGWAKTGTLKNVFAAAAATLRPGGVLGIVQHRSLAGQTGPSEGYLPEQTLIDAATAAGLQLSAKSEINANPYDKRDRPASTRSLTAAESGVALSAPGEAWIGESDRMTLRFVRTAP